MSTRTNFQIALNKLERLKSDDRIPHVLNEEEIHEAKKQDINNALISKAIADKKKEEKFKTFLKNLAIPSPLSSFVK